MSDLGQMAKQGVVDLGKGAYAATVLPSLAMVLIALGLLGSHLLPWQGPIVGAHGARVALADNFIRAAQDQVRQFGQGCAG